MRLASRLALLGLTLSGVLAAEEEQSAAQPAPASWFSDITAAAGVARKHTNRSFKNPYAHIMEGYTALGAAAAAGDFDGDGFEDLFVTDSDDGGRNLLYRNNGDLTFSEIGKKAGVAAGNDAKNASSNALWFDFDGDGWPDLLVVRFGHNLLYRNNGNGTFSEVTERAGLGREYLNSIAAIAFDHDLDGDLDLFVANYFAPVNLFDPQTSRFFPESFETADNGGGLTLYRNNGDGAFTDITEQAGLSQSGWSLDIGHADADHDGDDDLYVACDFGTDRFFRNNGDGTFTDITEQAIGIDTKKGMNVDWGDFDGDGLFDVFVTNITDEYMREGNFLWQNQGDLTFADVARETGTHNTGWGWAGKFFDADNDGWLDLFVVNGWVSAGPENYVLDVFELIVQPDVDLADATNWPPMGDKTLSGYQHNALFHNQEGALFADVAERHGVDSLLDGRGVAVADFDNDGRLDLFVTNANNPPFLYHNVIPAEEGGTWLQLRLRSKKPNPAAVGAKLWLTAGGRTQVSFVNGGNGFASQSTYRVHFGLGQTEKIDRLEVRWPNGQNQSFTDLVSNQIYDLEQGSSKARPLTVGAPQKSPRKAQKTSTKKGTGR